MTKGNRKSLSDFIKSEYVRMTYYVRGIISETADRSSEDVVQDVMAGIFEKADISEPIENVAAYVYRSLKNRVIDIMRKKDLCTESIDDENGSPAYMQPADDWEIPERLYERNEMTARLHGAIDSLPDELRSVLVMNEMEGRTFREISGITGIPVGTLTARKARAMEILRKNLINIKYHMED